MSKKKSKKKNKKDFNQIKQDFNQIKDANQIKQDFSQVEKQVEKKSSSNILGNSNVRALITALAAAAVEQLLELLVSQKDGFKGGSDRFSKLGDAIKEGSDRVEKRFDSNILGNSNVRALITALVTAAVEQLLELLANQEDGSKGGSDRLSKLGDAIKEAAASIQGMAEGKPVVTETVATVKDAIAEIKPFVAGVVPAVQGVVSALKDKADDGKAAVQEALPDELDGIQDTVTAVRSTSQS